MSSCSAILAKNGTPADSAMMLSKIILSFAETLRICYVCCADILNLRHRTADSVMSRLPNTTAISVSFGTMIAIKAYITATIVGFVELARDLARISSTARHVPFACPYQSKTLIDALKDQLSAIVPFAENTCSPLQKQWS
jgi:hypothetical protein